VAFLLARSGSSDQATATEIAELLGRLPLALEQAGAYVRETRIPLATYLERLRQFPAVTLTKGHPRDRRPTDTVATTWQVTLEQISPTPGAVTMLELCAFLAPDDVPRGLFAQQLDPPAEGLTVLAGDPFALDDAVAALRRFGLAKADEQTLTVHRVLQQVIREGLEPERQRQRAQVALRLVRAAFLSDSSDPALWPAHAQLLPHALVVTGHAERLDLDQERTAWLLSQAGRYLQLRADYQQARRLLERVLAIQEARLGSDHLDTATSLSNLGSVLYNERKLDEARALHERALEIRELRLGTEHIDTATSLDNLGKAVRKRDPGRARSLHERALEIRERRLGPDHPTTAESLNNLALALREQRHLARARSLHERALAIREARLGPDHPETANSLSNLALVVRNQGDLKGAYALHERALRIREARLGPNHPLTARSLHNLANILRTQGDLDRARALLERALAIREARLEPNHPHIARSLHSLARVVRDQGDPDTARDLEERAQAIDGASTVPDRPGTA
jgi:tetratricopeptide (TPR) repeat protein